MKRTVIYPYKMGSRSARALARAFRAKRVRPNGRYRPRYQDMVVNYGSVIVPRWIDHHRLRVLKNTPNAVTLAQNKLLTFNVLQNVARCVPFTGQQELAKAWVRKGFKVVCRKLLRASEGRGIVIARTEDEVVRAPLYTKYIAKEQEYRVHVFDGQVIHVQQKRRSREQERNQDEKLVRNHRNGWVFCVQGVEAPEDVKAQAIASVRGLGLDFGAVDIVVSKKDGLAYVLEVNTAPGIEGSTLQKYVEAVRRAL